MDTKIELTADTAKLKKLQGVLKLIHQCQTKIICIRANQNNALYGFAELQKMRQQEAFQNKVLARLMNRYGQLLNEMAVNAHFALQQLSIPKTNN